MISAGSAFAADSDAAVDAAADDIAVEPVIADIDEPSDELNSPLTDEISNGTDDVLSAGSKSTHITAVDMNYERSIVKGGLGYYPIVLTSGDIIPVPLANKTISVELGKHTDTYTTNSVGLVNYIIPTDTTSGSYKVNMKFAGDDTYKGCVLTTSINIVDVPIKIIAAEDVSYPSPLAVENASYYPIYLASNTTLLPVANKTVNINFNGNVIVCDTNELGLINYIIPNVPAGDYPISIVTDSDDGYYGARFSTTISIFDVPTEIIALENASYPRSLVTKNLAIYPIALTAEINVTDTSIPIVLGNKTIKVKFNNGPEEKFTTNALGLVNYTLDSNLASGKYPIEISYDADEGYIGSSFTTTIEVYEGSTKITAADNVSYPCTLAAQGLAYYPILLTGGTLVSIPLANETVHVEFNGVKKDFVTDNFGIINYTIPDSPAGDYTMKIVFDGDGVYDAASLTTHVNLYDIETSFIVPEKVVFNAEEVREGTAFYPIFLTINSTVSIPLANKTVLIDFNGAVTEHVTNAIGEIRYVIPQGAPAGNFTIYMTFEGQGGYSPANASGSVEITGINTQIIAPANMTVMVKDLDNTYFNMTLMDVDGNVLANQKVAIDFNGVSTTLTTDKNGAISYRLSKAPVGENIITMNYKGAGNYTGCVASSVINVVAEQKPAKIFLRNALYFVMQTKMVKVTLWDGNNKPLAGKTVHISLPDYGLKYSGVTDENGDALIRVGVGFGVHNATVSFDGDDEYAACNRSGFIRVIKETPSIMVRGDNQKFNVKDNPKIVKVYLWDRYSKPLPAGSKVGIKINGETFVGYTDSDGVANVEIKINNVGTYNAELMYGGNSAYNAVSKGVKFVIK